MKKGKVVLAQPAVGSPLSRAPGPVRGGGEEAAYRASLRYRGLLQDYRDLLKETQAKKSRLHLEKLKKRRLLAQVKFLRKRFKSLSENPSRILVCRGRNPAMPPPAAAAWGTDDDSEHRWSGKTQQPRRPDGPSRVIDLNQACEPLMLGVGVGVPSFHHYAV